MGFVTLDFVGGKKLQCSSRKQLEDCRHINPFLLSPVRSLSSLKFKSSLQMSNIPDALDGTIAFASLSTVPSLIVGNIAAVESSQSFEPVVNTPALFSFLLITVVFTLLQLRINSISNAATRREESLKALREVKSAQFESDESKRPTSETIQAAVSAYEIALRDELSLRSLLPGVRIVAPNDPKKREEDLAAAKQFLGMDLTDDGDALLGGDSLSTGDNVSGMDGVKKFPTGSKEEKKRLLLQSRRRFDGRKDELTSATEESEGGISDGGKAVLLGVALTQIVLLIFLSFDPMTANDIFTAIGDSPPSDIPLSSWSIE